MNQDKYQILLVEDDASLSVLLTDFLELRGYRPHTARDGEEGLRLFKKFKMHLCIIDVMLPKKDGFTLAEEIREKDKAVPIIFLTARVQDQDRVKGFKVGADDYITKPFSSEELGLRIEAVLRRCYLSDATDENESYQLGSMVFDYTNMQLIHGDKMSSLTPKEAALLRLLCKHKNSLLPREKALKEIWGKDDYFIGRSMDVFIARLRKHLRDEPAVSIVNVHGTGFRLEIDETVHAK